MCHLNVSAKSVKINKTYLPKLDYFIIHNTVFSSWNEYAQDKKEYDRKREERAGE